MIRITPERTQRIATVNNRKATSDRETPEIDREGDELMVSI